jgi:hypothetical protein
MRDKWRIDRGAVAAREIDLARILPIMRADCADGAAR